MALNHESYIRMGKENIEKGLEYFRISQKESRNILIQAIINNIEKQISMIDGKNQID